MDIEELTALVNRVVGVVDGYPDMKDADKQAVLEMAVSFYRSKVQKETARLTLATSLNTSPQRG